MKASQNVSGSLKKYYWSWSMSLFKVGVLKIFKYVLSIFKSKVIFCFIVCMYNKKK